MKKPAIIFFLLAGFLYLFYLASKPVLPSPDSEPILYSNQCRDDLKSVFLQAMDKANKTIHLLSYGLSDPNVLHMLVKKGEKVKIKAYYDIKSSYPLPKVEGIEFHPVSEQGLMHQKIVVIDEKVVLLGSANMTKQSLQMHDNLIVGFYSPKLAKFLIDKTPFTSAHTSSWVGGQKIDLWILPDAKNYAIDDLRERIRRAKKEIFMAMFTLTHPLLIEEVIEAKKRGVKVQIILDRTAAKGASKKVVGLLQQAKISLSISNGIELLHHKFLLIDQKDLILGSANWTKSAFYKNRDCFLVLNNLTKSQKAFMQKLINNIVTDSTP